MEQQGSVEPAKGTSEEEEREDGGGEKSGLEAEQESAAAMDADVPQPPDADKTTEGQPS